MPPKGKKIAAPQRPAQHESRATPLRRGGARHAHRNLSPMAPISSIIDLTDDINDVREHAALMPASTASLAPASPAVVSLVSRSATPPPQTLSNLVSVALGTIADIEASNSRMSMILSNPSVSKDSSAASSAIVPTTSSAASSSSAIVPAVSSAASSSSAASPAAPRRALKKFYNESDPLTLPSSNCWLARAGNERVADIAFPFILQNDYGRLIYYCCSRDGAHSGWEHCITCHELGNRSCVLCMTNYCSKCASLMLCQNSVGCFACSIKPDQQKRFKDLLATLPKYVLIHRHAQLQCELCESGYLQHMASQYHYMVINQAQKKSVATVGGQYARVNKIDSEMRKRKQDDAEL